MSSVPPLSHFPDLCLLNIFRHLPLVGVICELGFVCRNWYRLRRNELSRRTTLVLIQNFSQLEALQVQENPVGSQLIELVRQDDGMPLSPPIRRLDQIGFDAFSLPEDGVLTEEFVSRLVELLPNISQLTVMQMEVTTLQPVVSALKCLIDHFSANLVSFKLNFHVRNDSNHSEYNLRNDPKTQELVDSIYRLGSLRQLVLNINLHDRGSFHLPNSLDPQAPISDIACETPLLLQEMTRDFDPELAAKYTRVWIMNPLTGDAPPPPFYNCFDGMQLFCARFYSLKSLTLKIDTIPLTMLARCLAQLTQLIHLELQYSSIPQEELQVELPLAQVPSVLLLTLSHSRAYPQDPAHWDTERFHLAELFPNLQVILLLRADASNHECDICGVREQDYRIIKAQNSPNYDAVKARIENCLRLAREPFMRCAKLHSIKLDTVRNTFPLRAHSLI